MSYRLGLNNTNFTLAIIVDQLLLPMFHIGDISIKLSYLILGFWLINWITYSKSNVDEKKDIKKIFGVFLIIIACFIAGEMRLAVSHNIQNHNDAFRNIIAFILAALAFGLGRSSKKFRLEWLLPILFFAIALNLIFIIFKNQLPSWLISFYYPQKATNDDIGFETVEDIINLVRPRGAFGNSNASMLMVNINVLAICIALRKNIITIKSIGTAVSLVILPIILAMLLASRGEFLVSCILGFLNYKILKKSFGYSIKRMLIIIAVSSGVLGYVTLGSLGDGAIHNVERIATLVNVLDNSRDHESHITRPLYKFNVFWQRFQFSPFFGTGISSADGVEFLEGTQYFHNDWFYIATTSGILGLFTIVWLLSFLLLRLGWPVLIPFFLPGLVNTFVLNVPAFITYFGMLGVILSTIKLRTDFNIQKTI